MADVTSLEFKKDNVIVTDRKSTTYSASKTVGSKTCTVFVNDRTKNGFGKDDFFFYDGDISLFSQTEIKDLVDKGVDGKKYDANNVAKGKISTKGIEKLVKMDTCKDLEQGKNYELGSVFNCASKGAEAETKAQAEADAKVAAEAKAAAEAKVAAAAKVAEAAKTAPAVTPAATEKPAEAAKNEKPIPPPPAKAPEQNYNQDYYMPQQGGYEPPSMAATIGAPILAGGAIGGILGMLFGGARGFFGGFLGGAMGGLMSLFGGGMMGGSMMGGFGGGYGMGPDPMDAALNMTFARGLDGMSALMSQPIFIAPPQNRPAAPVSNLPELTDANFDKTIKDSKTPVVVEFVMDGCEPCKKQVPILEDISKDGKVKVYQANIDKAETIRKENKVEVTPTILVFKEGKVVKKLEGLKSKEELAAVLNENPSTVVATNK